MITTCTSIVCPVCEAAEVIVELSGAEISDWRAECDCEDLSHVGPLAYAADLAAALDRKAKMPQAGAQ